MAVPATGAGSGLAGPGAGYPQWGTLAASNGGGLNANTGLVIEVTNPAAKYLAEADNLPYALVWFTSQAAADAYAANRNPAGYQAGKSVSSFKQTVANHTLNPATNALSNPLGWTLQIGNTSGLLVRTLKVIIGGMLLLSGVLRLTGTDKAALGTIGKAAVFA